MALRRGRHCRDGGNRTGRGALLGHRGGDEGCRSIITAELDDRAKPGARPAIVLLLPFGLVGVGIALSATYLVVGFVSVELARSVVGTSRRETVACLWPTTLSAVVAFAVLLPLERLVVRSDHYPALPGLAWIFGECMLFLLVYIGVVRLTSPSRYRSVRNVVGRAVAKVTGPARRMVSPP